MLFMLVNMKKILSKETEQDPVVKSENAAVIGEMSKTSM